MFETLEDQNYHDSCKKITRNDRSACSLTLACKSKRLIDQWERHFTLPQLTSEVSKEKPIVTAAHYLLHDSSRQKINFILAVLSLVALLRDCGEKQEWHSDPLPESHGFARMCPFWDLDGMDLIPFELREFCTSLPALLSP